MVLMMKNKHVAIALCIFGSLILLLVGSIFYVKIQLIPKKYENNTVFTIEPGTYGKQVFEDLEEQGIIRDSKIDYIYIYYLSGLNIDFKAGSFELPENLSLEEIVETLCDDSKFYRPTEVITITEGEFILGTNQFDNQTYGIARTITNKLNVSLDELLNFWNDEDVLKGYIDEYPFLTDDILNPNIRYKLEGYLYPNTYEFYLDSSCDEITRKFLDQTYQIYKKYEDDFANAPKFYHYYDKEERQASIHEIFTLASILEWESGNDSQMQDISSVFYNRFEYPDMLRSSVTSCYSLGYDKDSCLLVDKDLDLAYTEDGETYNTYTKYDLPVGPISNPSEQSIYAALHPNQTDYFYFVGDICGIDGLTHFSTVEEGNEAISKKYVSCE